MKIETFQEGSAVHAVSIFKKKESITRNINSSNKILEVLRALKKFRVLNCRKNNFSFISPFFLKKIKLLFNFKAWDAAKHWCPFILLNFLLCSVFFQWRLCQQISVVLILSCRTGNTFFSPLLYYILKVSAF